MANDFLPFSKPLISDAAINEVVACLKSGWITTGPRVQEFTEALQDYFKAPFVLPLMTATAGLHLTLLAMELQPGDEVITTPLTFVATLNTIVLAGAKPVLVDIHPTTYLMDTHLIEAAITPRTRAILPVHFAGLPTDLDHIYTIAEKHGLRVLEDAAHAIGTAYKNQRIGSFGDTQVFSFHPNKNMTTGEGGCVVTRDAALAERIACLRFHGMDKHAADYEIIMPGYKANMTDIQAALGIHQLNDLDVFIKRRQQLAARYQEALSLQPQWQLPKKPDYAHLHAWHLYTPLLNEKIAKLTRSEFIAAMKEKNIGIGLHYRAAHLYPYYQQFGFKRGDYPMAEAVSDRIVTLPLFPAMSDSDQERVIDTMQQIFNSQGS